MICGRVMSCRMVASALPWAPVSWKGSSASPALTREVSLMRGGFGALWERVWGAVVEFQELLTRGGLADLEGLGQTLYIQCIYIYMDWIYACIYIIYAYMQERGLTCSFMPYPITKPQPG